MSPSARYFAAYRTATIINFLITSELRYNNSNDDDHRANSNNNEK